MRKLLLVICSLVLPATLVGAPEVKDGFFQTSDGVKLHYLEAGTGPGIVFEPGWTMPSWIWDAQIRYFSEHYHVLALDPRSQGDSDKPSDGNSPERRSQDIKELIDHLELGPVVLVGWSLGVSELLTYAEQFGGANVRAYVFVDGFVWDKMDSQFAASMLGTYRQVEVNRRNFTEKFVRSMYKKPQTADYIARVVEASLKMPADSAIAASAASASRGDWRPAIGKVDRPVLILCQAASKSRAADLIVSIVASTRVELFEDAGHALFVDDAQRFNSLLDDFVQHLATR